MLPTTSQKRLAIICLSPPGSAASHRYRFEQYVPALKREGFTVTQLSFYSPRVQDILYSKGNLIPKISGVLSGMIKRVGHLARIWRYDYVLIHREAIPLGPPWFEYLLGKFSRAKIIYDFDDAIWIQATSKENAIAARFKWAQKVPEICKLSHRISCGNEYLAQFSRKLNKNVTINPTTIDTSYHLPRPDRDNVTTDNKLTIGWTGSHSTLKYLKMVEPAIVELSKEFDFEFVVIADRPPPLENIKYRFIKWSIESEIDDLREIDIGIMPLRDSDWERGKCGFKALQYMAISVPAVVSPVGVNADIVRHEVDGFQCETTEEWTMALRRLLTDHALRLKMGDSGRQRVIDNYSVDSNTPNVISMFQP